MAVAGLVSVRAFEAVFYDPLREYFTSDYMKKPVPQVDRMMFFLHTTLRYILNTALSLFIIRLLFDNINYVKWGVYLFAGAYVLLMPVYLWFPGHAGSESAFALFYIRRFLIQPVLGMLLIPAFYYLENTDKKRKEGFR